MKANLTAIYMMEREILLPLKVFISETSKMGCKTVTESLDGVMDLFIEETITMGKEKAMENSTMLKIQV